MLNPPVHVVQQDADYQLSNVGLSLFEDPITKESFFNKWN